MAQINHQISEDFSDQWFAGSGGSRLANQYAAATKATDPGASASQSSAMQQASGGTYQGVTLFSNQRNRYNTQRRR